MAADVCGGGGGSGINTQHPHKINTEATGATIKRHTKLITMDFTVMVC